MTHTIPNDMRAGRYVSADLVAALILADKRRPAPAPAAPLAVAHPPVVPDVIEVPG